MVSPKFFPQALIACSFAGLFTLGLSAIALAQTPAQAPQAPNEALPDPQIYHAPVSVSQAGQVFQVHINIRHPERVRKASLLYRTPSQPAYQATTFERSSGDTYLAQVSPLEVVSPWLEYTIELETLEGKQIAAFASRQQPFRVSTPDSIEDLRERALLTRLSGRRSVATASAEYVHFGSTDAQVQRTPGGPLEQKSIRDQYYRIEAGYTYRPLGVIAEFSLRAGVVRGKSVVPNETDESKYDVGLNYGAPTVRFRAADWLHLEAEFLTSVTEVGFSTGAGGAVLLGDPYGTKLTLGFESIETFGTRFYSRMDLGATDKLWVSPIVEVTDMPHADRYGLRLLSEVRYELGEGFGIALRGGYQARTFASGGASAGTTLSYAF